MALERPREATRTLLFSAAVAVLASAPCASAIEGASSSTGERTAGYVQAGFSTASPHMSGAAFGGSLLLHAGRRLAVEAAGAFADRGAGASAASLSASAVLHLVSREDKAVPYLVAGGGFYHASFDTRSGRFAGPAPAGEMRAGRLTHVMEGAPAGWDLGQLPPFYAGRVASSIARDGRSGRLSFNDPALNLGAGVRIRLGSHWSVRQDARFQLVIRGGDTYGVGLFTLQLGRGF